VSGGLLMTLPSSDCGSTAALGAAAAVSSGVGGTIWATRWSSPAGKPMWKSQPRGSATSSRKNLPGVLPLTRRISSPTR